MINDQQVDNPPTQLFCESGGGTSDVYMCVRIHFRVRVRISFALVWCCGMITTIQYVGPAIAARSWPIAETTREIEIVQAEMKGVYVSLTTPKIPIHNSSTRSSSKRVVRGAHATAGTSTTCSSDPTVSA